MEEVEMLKIIFFSIIGILIIFMLRGVFLWYYKINERINLLQENNDLLKKLISGITGEPLEKEEEQL